MNAPAAPADEQRRFIGGGNGLSHIEPMTECLDRFASYGHSAGLVTLSRHFQCTRFTGYIPAVQGYQLRKAQAAGVKKLHHGMVSQFQGVLTGRRVEQPAELVRVHGGGQVALYLGRPDALNRI